ncbi:FHA domain-containing protein [Nonomuraea sp. NEAU-A123]|uniref:FHA domain-containing protein n=1 Tax=Nonomuraea sp. NEAU-A123 TaxID=2839649 RepID=UPI001BE492B8|nr:FHA domain-containing protein [Nonomuraea sp. NEAU-A123]MBT2229354.1 FHA domain-containing protein [Nonomuraea sp. NEAU-A123]
MATCPQGHASGDDEYCDVCGLQMAGSAAPAAATSPAGSAAPAGAGAGAAVESCPVCQTPRAGQFCEVCGHDYSGTAPSLAPVSGARWEAVTAADRAYYDQVIAEGGPDAHVVAFPPYCPERSFALSGEQVRIGRRSRGRDLRPEIDLTGPPEDPGVSHLHAVLLAQHDGSWTLVDPGSANGTQVNGKPVSVNVPVRVGAGDRIHLGAWTVITIREGTP